MVMDSSARKGRKHHVSSASLEMGVEVLAMARDHAGISWTPLRIRLHRGQVSPMQESQQQEGDCLCAFKKLPPRWSPPHHCDLHPWRQDALRSLLAQQLAE
ncbi:hypothetical protein AK812_SmicGene9178 [Symbiodinium microadriaticum]|uniref:Uncharacterized protein n=1 Tax=Symbiodinium microadriaticum TaxID=2951 RepID=A0A1Q9EJ19_SYMMI|nr:hypothetical protein AK812_SmicGene9178 [Symbiodinium microadriaticum]